MAEHKIIPGALLHRYLTAIIFACTLIVLVGSSLSGARIITIVYRCTLAFVSLYFIRSIILKSWNAWQETMRGATGSRSGAPGGA